MSLHDITTFPEIKKTLSEYVDFIHDHNQHPELDEENVMKCLGELEGCTVSEHELKVYCLINLWEGFRIYFVQI